MSIDPGTADAATAADPALVPGTTYAYTAPDIQVPDQVLIEIESAAALNATAADRKQAQDLPTGWHAAADLPGQCDSTSARR